MTALVDQVLQWTGSHAHLAGLVVLLVAFAESLAGVGLLVPGAVILFGVGALIAAGALPLWSTLIWAAAGAAAGDGLSYWLGRHYGDQVRQMWPFRAFPGWLDKAESFCHRHGGKSIVLGRFVGPLRPVVPVMVGMLGMTPGRFFAFMLPATVAWAPAYLLPGMAVGASLTLAGEVAARLAILLAALGAAAWLLFVTTRFTYRWLRPMGTSAMEAIWRGASHNRMLSWLFGDLLDPQRPEFRGLLLWFTVLLMSASLFLLAIGTTMSGQQDTGPGHALYNLLQQLRTPVGDSIMVFFSALGDFKVVAPVTVTVLAWLLWRRAWYDTAYWLATATFGALAVVMIKGTLRIPRPQAMYSGVDSWSFPSGHATMSTLMYGFLAVLISQSWTPPRRWLPYALASILVAGISFSRLYLGVHWFADVAGGLSLGVSWIAILAITRHHHHHHGKGIRGLATVSILALAVAGYLHVQGSWRQDLQRYAIERPVRTVDVAQWWQHDWNSLPAYRSDLEGDRRQPLNVQWSGELDDIETLLQSQQWRQPLTANIHTALNWLLPNATPAKIPLLPRLHDGQHESLLLVHDDATAPDQRQLIIRLWPTDIRLTPDQQPLWVGSVAEQRVVRLPLINLLRLTGDYDEPLRTLSTNLAGARTAMRVHIPLQHPSQLRWNGDILLVNTMPAGR